MSTQQKKQRAQSTRELSPQELDRLELLCSFERQARAKGYKVIAGIDEAGRGPLAGPVVAASCLIDEGVLIPGIDDSKKLTPQRREQLFQELTEQKGVAYGLGIVSAEEIDRINILQATIVAMQNSLEQLNKTPDYMLVDGLKLSYRDIPCQKIIRGDALSYVIAAASILAKVTRDRLMYQFHKEWPQYGFDQHKGYGTEQHIAAIKKHGPCKIHRRTFEPIKSL